MTLPGVHRPFGTHWVRGIALLVPMVLCSLLSAQSTGRLRLNTEPAGLTEFVLDGKYRMKDRELNLLEGPHQFVFWAPERRMLDTTIRVVAGSTQDIKVSLRYSEEFMAYRRQLGRYEATQRWGRYGPPVVAGLSGAWAVVSYLRYTKAHNDLQDLQQEYRTQSDPGAIATLKQDRIPDAKDSFRSARAQSIIAGSLFAVSAGATWYIRRELARKGPPVFEDKERVRFDGLVWLPGNANGTWSAALSIPIR